MWLDGRLSTGAGVLFAPAAYLAIAVSDASNSEMEEVARDLAAMDSLLDRLRAPRRHDGGKSPDEDPRSPRASA